MESKSKLKKKQASGSHSKKGEKGVDYFIDSAKKLTEYLERIDREDIIEKIASIDMFEFSVKDYILVLRFLKNKVDKNMCRADIGLIFIHVNTTLNKDYLPF